MKMKRETIDLRLKAMLAEVVRQMCDAANKEADLAISESIAAQFLPAVSGVLDAIEALPDRTPENQSN